MAACNIDQELLNSISSYNYISEVIHLAVRDVLPQQVYKLTGLGKNYWLDTRRCYHFGCKNPDQLFELFGLLIKEDASEVRADIIHLILSDPNFYLKVGRTHLNKLGLTLDQWLLLMESPSVYGDELMLYALARTF